jgi:hypothetical protein
MTAISGGAAVGLACAALSIVILGDNLAAASAPPQNTAEFAVNRESKTDALPVPDTPQTRAEIKSVEVVGVRGASIVYRDRSGNILFRTDPLANVTVVTKNVELPEVTVRETETTKVERVPADEAQRSEQPRGCESEFARPAPEALTRMSSRCVTDLGDSARSYAALR